MIPCLTCQNPDGTPNAAFLDTIGACCFDGRHVIDRDHGFCPDCGDHAANEAKCETCGAEYNDWSGKWERTEAAVERGEARDCPVCGDPGGLGHVCPEASRR